MTIPTLLFEAGRQRSRKISVIAAGLLLLALSATNLVPAAAASEQPAGFVKTLEGDAIVLRQGHAITILPGTYINAGDIVKTNAKSAVGIIFSDDTLVSLGPETQIAVDHYLFDPTKKQLGFVTRLIKGTLSFISGQITRLSPESTCIIVPSATIGVRGTHVLISVDN